MKTRMLKKTPNPINGAVLQSNIVDLRVFWGFDEHDVKINASWADSVATSSPDIFQTRSMKMKAALAQAGSRRADN